MNKANNKKRKLSPIGKLCVFLLILLLLVAIISRCAVYKRSRNAYSDVANPNPNFTQDVINGMYNDSDKIEYAKRTKSTETLKVDSEYGILIDVENNTIVAEKGGNKKIYPASLTKIMTLIVAVEEIEDLNQKYTFKAETLDKLYNEEASVAGFLPDETVSATDILYGAILPSGADATVALAEIVAGSEKEFVKLMNLKANEMGLKQTHFMNSSGLHDEFHYTTPHEMALITNYAVNNKKCFEILSAISYTTAKTEQHPDGIELYSTMFSTMYGNEAETVTIKAGKTGFTNEGGNCLASYAETEKGGKYVLVTTNGSGRYAPTYDAFNAYSKHVGNGTVTITPEITY